MGQLFNIFGRITIDGLGAARSELRNINRTGSKVGSTLKGIGSSIAGVGTKMTVGLTVPIVGLIGKSAMLASDLNESMNVVNETFGKSSKEVTKWAGSLNNNYGMVKLEAMEYVGSMGAMLKSSGLSSKASKDMSKSLVELTGDMSSFYNLSHDETWEKIRAGISGETEPLKSLGINMSVANLEAYALSQGINTSWKEMSQAEQVTLRYNYLMDTTKTAQGDFARTSEGFSNQLKILKGNLTNVGVSVGEIVLPYFNKGVKIVNSLTKRFEALSPSVKKIVVIVGLAVAIIGPLLLGFGTLIGIVGTAITGFSALAGVIGAISAPMIAIGIAIAAIVVVLTTLTVGLGYVLVKTGTLQEIWKNLKGLFYAAIPVIKSLAKEGFEKLKEAIGFVKHVLDDVARVAKPFIFSTLKEAKPIVKDIIKNFKEFGIALLDRVGKSLKSMKKTWDSVWPKLKPIVKNVFKIVKTVIISALKIIKETIKFWTSVMKGDWKGAWNSIKNIIKTVLSGIKSIAKAGFNSTKTIMKNVLNAMKNKVNSIWNSIKNKINSTLNNIKSKISSKLNSAKKTVSGFVSKFKNAAKKIGIGIINGIVAGIKAAPSKVSNALGNVVGNAVASAKRRLGISSPSKVFMEIGKFSTEGLKLGLQKDKREISNTLNSLLDIRDIKLKTGTTNKTLGTSTKVNTIENIPMNEKKDVNINMSGTIKVDTGKEIFEISREKIEQIISQSLINNLPRYTY